MKSVFKYLIEISDVVELEMPVGAVVLHLAEQHGVPCLWALVDLEAPNHTRRFRLAGTGHPIDTEYIDTAVGNRGHLGTFFMRDGALVWHLFEMRRDI